MSINPGGFSDHIAKQFNNPELSDVAIVLDNDEGEDNTSKPTKTFHGHRVILATMSDYFRSMLFGSFLEASKKEIRLPGVPYSTFMELMRYVYFGWTDPEAKTLEKAAEFYSLARMLLLDSEMGTLFEVWMVRHAEKWDYLKMFTLAFEWDMRFLKLACNNNIRETANEYLAKSSFLELPLGAVQMLLDTSSINCTRAELEQAIQTWIVHHEGEISTDAADELNRMVAKFGELCYSFDLLSLYTKEELLKSEEALQIVEFSEPMEAMLEAVHEYSYKSTLRVTNCIDLRGVKISLRANPQFGPQYRRIKSELELCLKITCQDEECRRNLSIHYDFTQQEQQSVTIFFPEMTCCKYAKLIFNFSWKGAGVQPILQNYGFVNSMTLEGDSSYVTHTICKTKLYDYDSDGRCPDCPERDGPDLFFRNSCSCCHGNFDEDEDDEQSENEGVEDSV